MLVDYVCCETFKSKFRFLVNLITKFFKGVLRWLALKVFFGVLSSVNCLILLHETSPSPGIKCLLRAQATCAWL